MINRPDPDSSVYPPDYPTVSMDPNTPVGANNVVQSSDGNGGYEESRRENYVDPNGNQVARQVSVREDKNVRNANMRYWISTVVYFLLGVLEVILGLRFVFRLLGANQSSGFVTFLYGLSHVFVGPFNNIFNDQALGSSSVFEFSTLVAMVIYGLIAWGLVSLGRVAFAPTYTGSQRVSTIWRRQR